VSLAVALIRGNLRAPRAKIEQPRGRGPPPMRRFGACRLASGARLRLLPPALAPGLQTG